MSLQLILCMIVKNESRILRRCLNSVADLIDGLVICDTGSTDNTIHIIEIFATEKKLPCRITKEAWKNFGHNRSIVLRQACEFAKHSPRAYLLTIDADMVLQRLPTFDRNELATIDKWDIEQRGGLNYWNPRIIRASIAWSSTGVTHEYLETPKGIPVSNARLHDLWIDDRNDGGSKDDKAERDIRLLEAGLRDDPQNYRYMFYLGNTYRETGRYVEAIAQYEKHRLLQTWDEERWVSLYYIGQCYEELKIWPKALETYLQAYQERPKRVEPLHRIARYYRLNDKPCLGFPFALAACQVPIPTDESLFLDKSIYDFGCLEELSITSFYATVSLPICEESTYDLLSKKGVPDYYRNTAAYNLRFVIKTAPFEMKWEELVPPPDLLSNYRPCNPSFVFVKNGQRRTNIRMVNYRQRQARNYVVPENGIINTENILDGVISESKWHGAFYDTCHIRGFEDIRLVMFQGQVYASATSLETRADHLPQIVLFNIRSPETVIPLIYLPDKDRCQKNWLLFERNDELLAIYSYAPLTILNVDVETGLCTLKHITLESLDIETRHFKGGGICAYPDTIFRRWLVVVHETHDKPEERRYWHRLVVLDEGFQWRSISRPFYFRYAEGVEFCSCVQFEEGRFFWGIGEEDSKAAIMSASLQDVLNFCIQ